MARLEAKYFQKPDETLSFEKVSLEQVKVGGVSAWRCVFEPGWRYTEHVEPSRCPAPHVAYIESGSLGVAMNDGSELVVGPGAIVVIDPDHDAWTVGDEPCVFIDFGESVPLS